MPEDYIVAQDGLLLIGALEEPIEIEKSFTNDFWENAPDEYKNLDDLDLEEINARIKNTVGDW